MGQDSRLKGFQALQDPLIIGNLLLRLALWAWITHLGSYILGDALYYLDNARKVCAGVSLGK